MFSIGEFSRVSGMSIKTLRYYHEQGLLVPAMVDDQTGYRHYTEIQIERARIIQQLKSWQFSLNEIRDILARCETEADLLGDLERQLKQIEEQVQRQRSIARDLKKFIAEERQAEQAVAQSQFQIIERDLPPLLIAGYRMQARYDECGTGFAKVARSLGRYLAGPSLCLYHSDEYQEEAADYETCFPVRPCKAPPDISVRELTGGRFLTLQHLGPYNQLGRSYSRLLRYARQNSIRLELPSREVYLKGPGMIFRGNPQKYLTEIQIPICP